MKRLLWFAILAAAACGKSKPTVAKGNGFSIPIPAGWELVSDGPKNRVALNAPANSHSDFFLGFAVTPVPPEPGSSYAADLSELPVCERFGADMAKESAGALTLRGTKIVMGPMGKTCGFDFFAESGKNSADMTVVRGSHGTWLTMCTHRPSDEEQVRVCAQILAGWKFE